MSPGILAALIGTFGSLAGVLIGAFVTHRMQKASWNIQQADQSRRERREVYGKFLASARDWRATVLSANVEVVTGSPASRVRHADGGPGAAKALAIRSELVFLAHSARTIAEAQNLVRALGKLAEARAEHAAGSVPTAFVQACRDSEALFLIAAREELGLSMTDGDLVKVLSPSTLSPNPN